VARFGGGLPQRQPADNPPSEPAFNETNYVQCLFEAYSDHLNVPVRATSDINLEVTLHEHFIDCRREFYSAESLRTFSRDTLPPGEFERLQEEMHSGIKEEVRTDHADGYRRVLAVVKMAKLLQITDHALIGRLSVRDRGGICHQLANDKKVRWTK